jgi:hypothetical protein
MNVILTLFVIGLRSASVFDVLLATNYAQLKFLERTHKQRYRIALEGLWQSSNESLHLHTIPVIRVAPV